MGKFPFYKQFDTMDCGPSCLRMIAKHYGKVYSLEFLRERCFLTREGVSLGGISAAAKHIGFRTYGAKVNLKALQKEITLPCIAHWKQEHFVVVHKIKKDIIQVADPAMGLVSYTTQEFLKHWASSDEETGIVLILEPTPEFADKGLELDTNNNQKSSMAFLYAYITGYKAFLFQLFLSVVLGSLIQLAFPFLTQAIVDFGVNTQNLSFIYIILIAQLTLFVSRVTVEALRGWLLLHISARISISIISDFLIKLLQLPIAFFDTKMTGDLLQRIKDHDRIKHFLTSNTLNVVFSLVNLLIFGIILAIYSWLIFAIFIGGSALAVGWIVFFQRRRRLLDHQKFTQLAENQSALIRMIHGIQEIKLNAIEDEKRWEWEDIQAKTFKIDLKHLSLQQMQEIGTSFINELKNIIITFFAAKAVIDGNMTLGMMMAVAYIIGQLNTPLQDLVDFMRKWQDAQISLERMGEIHHLQDEDTNTTTLNHLPEDKSFYIDKVNFRYNDGSPNVIKALDLTIPQGKVTAIVGSSGSGKTTLIKLLLKFYEVSEGIVKVGDMNLTNFNHSFWRQQCGVVMQEGFIFSDTIAYNIAAGAHQVDFKRLRKAAKMANIHHYIEKLPLSYNTKIGDDGINLSVGQKQRLLIARAIYKDPQFLFLDEATSALDATNEKIIKENLDEFFKDRTVVVVAHRLSTVKNADQILVLEQGKIVEQGTHEELTEKKGAYFHLVKNQLELGT